MSALQEAPVLRDQGVERPIDPGDEPHTLNRGHHQTISAPPGEDKLPASVHLALQHPPVGRGWPPGRRSSEILPSPLGREWPRWRHSSEILPSPTGRECSPWRPSASFSPLPWGEGDRPGDTHLKSCPLPGGEGGPP